MKILLRVGNPSEDNFTMLDDDLKTPQEWHPHILQHDYTHPSFNQIDNDQEEYDEDELNSNAEAFEQEYENNSKPLDDQPDVSNLNLV